MTKATLIENKEEKKSAQIQMSRLCSEIPIDSFYNDGVSFVLQSSPLSAQMLQSLLEGWNLSNLRISSTDYLLLVCLVKKKRRIQNLHGVDKRIDKAIGSH